MLYYSNSDEDLTICLNCNKIFIEPKILPCGNIICEKCIFEIKKTTKIKLFNCLFCAQEHKIDDLPTCQEIKKFKSITMTNDSVEFLVQIGKINQNLKDLKENLNNPSSKIQSYCDNLIFEIDLKTESAIEVINKNRIEMINDINDFKENKCSQLKKCFDQNNFVDKIELSFKNLKDSFELKRQNFHLLVDEAKGINKNILNKNSEINNYLHDDLLYIHEPTLELSKNCIAILDKNSNYDTLVEKLRQVGKKMIDYKIKYQSISNVLSSINRVGNVANLIESI